MSKRYAVEVTWNDGREELLLRCGSDDPQIFSSFDKAKEMADFMREGMEDFQSLNVIEWNPQPALKP